ncbi:MAG TPA: tRNA adenosine(34) deaminase TadA [Phycisphaerae bacterium]|nr:tRNA adenosine(34) deaminase TadA [Phycisphaerae bacterium]
MIDRTDDERFMRAALTEAALADEADDVPVGAVVVHSGRIIGRGHNQKERLRDPTAHAEMLAITAATAARGDWRLTGCTLYATLEPCAMCAGAMVLARIDRLVFGTADPKTGACGSVYNLVADPTANHQIVVTRGILEFECGAVLQAFFARQRDLGKKG